MTKFKIGDNISLNNRPDLYGIITEILSINNVLIAWHHYDTKEWYVTLVHSIEFIEQKCALKYRRKLKRKHV